MAEIMTRATHTDILHDVNPKRLFIHLNAPDTAHALTQHIIVDNQALQTETKKRGMHASSLIDHIETGQSCQDSRASFFIARLRIRHL